jgi:hypothetical protein
MKQLPALMPVVYILDYLENYSRDPGQNPNAIPLKGWNAKFPEISYTVFFEILVRSKVPVSRPMIYLHTQLIRPYISWKLNLKSIGCGRRGLIEILKARPRHVPY